jgi:hypothetical protein
MLMYRKDLADKVGVKFSDQSDLGPSEATLPPR